MKRLLAVFLLLALLTGCGTNGTNDTGATGESGTSGQSQGNSGQPQTETLPFSGRDQDASWEEGETVSIVLEGDTATADSDGVRIEGSLVTITRDGTYLLTGTLEDGMVVVDVPETAKPQLVFQNAHISSATSAPLYILEGDKVFLTLAPDSENSLTSGESFVAVDDNNIDGALFSKQDLTINGTGSLTVTAPAGHGIVCKDDLTITGGNLTLTSASHGLDVNDSVAMGGGSLTVNAGKDGIHCENSDDAQLGWIWLTEGVLKLEAQGDGISAGAWFQADGGTVDILAGGGSVNGTKASSGFYGGFGGGPGGPPGWGGEFQTQEEENAISMKGIKTQSQLQITGGSFSIDAADDALHSNTDVVISGGTFTLATGDDGVHGEETLTITDGQMVVTESYEGLEALEITISGGQLTLHASDDGINAAGGTDDSGNGGRDGMFGGGFGGPGGMGGGPGGMGSAGNGAIVISGGTIFIHASGDGLDANGSLTISGGLVQVANPAAGDTSVLDSDLSPVITGGTFLGSGSTTMMAQSFSTESTQGVLACTIGNQSGGSQLMVTDPAGETVISLVLPYDSVLVILSSPDLVKGETYTLTIGDISGTLTAA